jgi:hypothetical protein
LSPHGVLPKPHHAASAHASPATVGVSQTTCKPMYYNLYVEHTITSIFKERTRRKKAPASVPPEFLGGPVAQHADWPSSSTQLLVTTRQKNHEHAGVTARGDSSRPKWYRHGTSVTTRSRQRREHTCTCESHGADEDG